MLSNWDHVEEIFHAALKVPTDIRASLLTELCGDSLSLRAEVDSLLALDCESMELLHEPTGKLAAELLALERPLLEVGMHVANYRIISLLGKGGMGEVYLAEHNVDRRNSALKVLPRRLASTTYWLHRFAREARATAAINHPNVVEVYEYGQCTHGCFIAMEYIEGQSLGAALANRLPIHTALNIMCQTAKALAAAHKLGIIHRDIKPENLMMRADGVVKILDFGLALRNIEEQDRADSASGTVNYMSPQQLRGQIADPASDIFSLGIVAYEMLTGAHPFHGDTNAALMQSIEQTIPAPPNSIEPDIPSQISTLVEAMLAKDTGSRPTAEAVASKAALFF